MKNIVIFGTGGLAREVHQIVEDINGSAPAWKFLGFLDGNVANHGKEVHGSPVFGGVEWLTQTDAADVYVVVAIGNPVSKRKIIESIKQQSDAHFATLVHPRAWVGSFVDIGQGSIICAGALITTDIKIGEYVIVNIGSTIGHDACIDDFVTIAPTVNVSGSVHVGQGTDLGTGSTVIQGCSIGEWSIVGAGAVVVKNIDANVTAVGAPAKAIKTRAAGWHLE
ncbi:acetyltransferase [Collimonas humicola]|uniref:acetyltransferase n=1 Tax=Collimonas humicola TaxID=2825886 RepID=UPI001B8AE2DC|nr:acetyltransferase [Collimonas humicola]